MSRWRTSPRAARPAPGASEGSTPAERIEEAIRHVFAPHLLRPHGARFTRAWRKTLSLLRPLGAVSQGNRVRVLIDGDEVFEAIWAAIAGAARSVVLTTYILEPDRVGERTLAELERAAARGCRVLIVLDSFGSHRVAEQRLSALRAAGATVIAFNPIVRWSAPLSRLVRNHRKIVVVDGHLAFCGGMNLAEEYAGTRHGTGLFRDTQLALEGPCARDLAALVEREVSEGPASRPHGTFDSEGSGSLVQILESHVRRQRRQIQKALRLTLGRTLERCYLTSPYFVPPQRLKRALQHAARRGVDVRVLTAGRSDVPIVRLASQHLYGRLLRAGVRIFELGGARVLHAKTVTVDGVYASVGSFNLDYWSDRRNLEVSVSVLDRGAAGELEQQFLRDLEGAEEVRLENWVKRSRLTRVLGWVAYQMLRL